MTLLAVPEHIYTLDNRDLQVACEAALEGAKIIKHAWENQPTMFKEKDGHYDLVSEVDEKSDECIQRILRAAFPQDPILSEELSPELECESRRGRLWICDPLDGTACFLFRTDPSAPTVMIALTVDYKPVVSVIVQPILGKWTYAVRGVGTFCDGRRMRMRKSSQGDLKHAWVDLNQYGDREYESELFTRIDKMVRSPLGARLVSRSPPYSAIALRLLSPVATEERGLAACLHDHNPLKPKQLPWDIVPVQLIIEEAGGEYVDACKGLDERLDPFNLQGPILIGNRSTIEYILKNA